MRVPKLVRGFLLIVAALALVFSVAPATQALTPRTTSGCTTAITPGAGINNYPAWPNQQSALMASNAFTVHDFSNVLWHNGAARTTTNAAAIPGGALSFGATNCTDINGAF